MRQLGGVHFDSFAFAREGAELVGLLSVKDLPRLAEHLTRLDGSLTCTLRGGRGEDGKLCLWLEASGELGLLCQRCLQEMQWPVRIEATLLLVAPGAPWPDEELEDDSADAIPASAEQSLPALVEDEVLLALPLAPRHANCALPTGGDGDTNPASPFAMLAKIKKIEH